MIQEKSIAVFPGQGSQQVGMVKDFYQQSRHARQLFEEASDAIRIDLKKLCFEGSEQELTLTENTQPCLLLASVVAFEVTVRETGFKPAVVVGHSLGEYSALVASGAIHFASAIRWVRARGIAMQKAVPSGSGSMAAIIGLEDEKVSLLCKMAEAQANLNRPTLENSPEVDVCVEAANFNAPGQVVIAGSSDGIREALLLAKTDPAFTGAKAIPLQVSAPFHCKLMNPARETMSKIFSQIPVHEQPRSLNIPYVPNFTSRLSHQAGTVFEFLVEQVVYPVLWRQSMTGLLEQGLSYQVEFGPGKVLSGLMKRIASSVGKHCELASVSDISSLSAFDKLLHTTKG